MQFQEAEATLAAIRQLISNKLRGPDLPPSLVDIVTKLCELFAIADEAQRHNLVSQADYKSSFVLFGFARWMAIQAIRTGSREFLTSGVIALLLEDQKFDARDTLMVFALLVHSAAKLLLDPATFYAPTVSLGEPSTQKLLTAFLARTPATQRIDLFNARESGAGRDFTYLALS
jgi:hypothetical protein